MEESGVPAVEAVEELARRYLKAFEDRRLEDCMEFFTEESRVEFMGQFRGLQDIEQWHKARFAAELKLIRLDRVEVRGNQAILDGVATSARLRAWKVKSINGRVTAEFDGPKIKLLTFSVRA
jgi:hypothetical protein